MCWAHAKKLSLSGLFTDAFLSCLFKEEMCAVGVACLTVVVLSTVLGQYKFDLPFGVICLYC